MKCQSPAASQRNTQELVKDRYQLREADAYLQKIKEYDDGR